MKLQRPSCAWWLPPRRGAAEWKGTNPVMATNATAQGSQAASASALRGLWLAITVLAATLTGAAGGLLAWVGGANPPMSILTGAGAFSGTVLLLLAMLRFAADNSD
jgi:hypothetical protein